MILKFRWLGTAGLELHLSGQVVLVDPFLTRPPAWKVIAMRGAASDLELIKQHISRADQILVTHSHYDHVLDVPEIMRLTGAPVYGSANTCKLISVHELPDDRIIRVKTGDRFSLGSNTVDVFPATHTHTPLDRWINGPLPARVQQGRLPIRLVDYRMDECFSFRIQTDHVSFMLGNYPAAADVLFISPFYSQAALAKILMAIRPRLVVPIHWDNFILPLSAPLRPMPVTARQGWGRWPPVRLVDLNVFSERIRTIDPSIDILHPNIFHLETYELD